jgi:hypothetical protein
MELRKAVAVLLCNALHTLGGENRDIANCFCNQCALYVVLVSSFSSAGQRRFGKMFTHFLANAAGEY